MATVDNVSIAYSVVVPLVLTTAIALILTLLRLYVRVRVIKLVGWDDLFNVLAMVTLLVVMGLVLGAVHNGLGRHIKFLNPNDFTFAIKLLRIAEFVVIVSTVFVKISISLFLKRLFLTSKRWNVFFWSFIAFNTTTSLIDAAVIFPQCTPVALNWDKSIQGHCWSDEAINALGITQGTIAAATDIILSILPVIFLWSIKISLKIKVGVCGLMALGFASGGFAVARTYLVPSLTATHDPTWDLVPLFKWATLEATFGVIAAAAPSMRPLFQKSGSTSYSNTSRSKSNSLPLHNIGSRQESRHSISGGRIVNKPGAPDPYYVGEENMDGDHSDGASDLKHWEENIGVGEEGKFNKVDYKKGTTGILKTTNLQITTTQLESDGARNRSSQEGLIR